MKNKDNSRGFGVKNVGECKVCGAKKSRPQKIYCSLKCYWKNKKGKSHGWGRKISLALRGKKKSPEHIRRVALANTGQIRPSIQGKRHWAWKGNDASYGSLHDWVARKLGRKKRCSKCKTTDKKRRYQWANISGKYKRDTKDWIRLCVKCHREMDRNLPRATIVYNKKGRHIKDKK